MVQALARSFWRRWRNEYLPTLQRRTKWQKDGIVISVGDLVLVAEDNTQPLHWDMGRVKEVYLDNDGIVRVARVKLAKATLTRPVVKLRPLPVATTNSL